MDPRTVPPHLVDLAGTEYPFTPLALDEACDLLGRLAYADEPHEAIEAVLATVGAALAADDRTAIEARAADAADPLTMYDLLGAAQRIARATPGAHPRRPAGRVHPREWTDDEWLRVLAEFPPNADQGAAAEAVYRWRTEAG